MTYVIIWIPLRITKSYINISHLLKTNMYNSMNHQSEIYNRVDHIISTAKLIMYKMFPSKINTSIKIFNKKPTAILKHLQNFKLSIFMLMKNILREGNILILLHIISCTLYGVYIKANLESSTGYIVQCDRPQLKNQHTAPLS